MKIVLISYLVVGAIVLSTFISDNTYCQKTEPATVLNYDYAKGNPADWPKEMDAVIAAPKNHKVLLENDNVRVLEVTLLPGEKEPIHCHKWHSVLYIEAAGDFIDHDAAGNILMDTQKLSTPLKFPLIMYKEPEAPHWVDNLSKTITLRLIRVEMKK
jgi:hypothetical protein